MSALLHAEERVYPHHMLREIYEQPGAIARTLEEYLGGEYRGDGELRGAGCAGFREARLSAAAALFRRHADLIVTASGSSRHAGLAAEILFEDLAGLTVDVEYASEYACRSTHLKRHPEAPSPVLALSQSGETADTLAALREANRRGHPTLAITNVPGSTMMREAGAALATPAGRELAIPATKSFTSQLTLLLVLALLAARERGAMREAELAARLNALPQLAESIARQLPGWESEVARLAALYADAKTFLFLGRGVHYAIAREGALKLKESSYLHAEGYPTGELKHGPNALVSAEVPLVVLATVDAGEAESVLRYEKTLALLGELRRQGARVLAVANAGDGEVAAAASDVIGVEPLSEAMLPIAEVVPLQLFAYFMAIQHGVNVDRPRNLTKAVTTE